MFLFNFSVFVYYRYCISQSSSAILLTYDTCCCFHHHIKLSVELFHTASELFFFSYSSSQRNAQSVGIIVCSSFLLTDDSNSLLISSITFVFEFTDLSVQKRSQSSYIIVNGVWMCMRSEHNPVSIAVVQFPNMNFPLQLDSNATDRPLVI